MATKNVVPQAQYKDWFLLKLGLKGGTKGQNGCMNNIIVTLEFGKLGFKRSEDIGSNTPFQGKEEMPETLEKVLVEVASGIFIRYTTEKSKKGGRVPREKPLLPGGYTKENMAKWLIEEAKKQWREKYSKVFPE